LEFEINNKADQGRWFGSKIILVTGSGFDFHMRIRIQNIFSCWIRIRFPYADPDPK